MSKKFKMEGIEAKDGNIQLYEERIVLFPPSIITILGSIYGDAAQPLLRFLGKRMGRRLAEVWEAKAEPNDLKDMTDLFVSMSSTAGWGEFSIMSISDNEIIINLTNNVANKEKMNYICYFLCGYFVGFGEFVFHRARVKETRCSVLDGGDYCQFVIKKIDLDL